MSNGTRIIGQEMPAHMRRLLPEDDPLHLPGVSSAAVTAVCGSQIAKSAPRPSSSSTGERQEKSPLATKFEEMWRAIDGPGYVTEYGFHPDRRFRFDYAWPCRAALELQGGIYLAGKGGHVSPKGVRNDCDKLNLATATGWRLFKLATGQITLENLEMIKNVILRLEAAPDTWKAESLRLFQLAGVTGEERHAVAGELTKSPRVEA